MTRINQFVAKSTGVSRRNADELIESGRIKINGSRADLGQQVGAGDSVTLDGDKITQLETVTIFFNKPVGYVCSRKGQGGDKTIYDLLPRDYAHLNPVGRLDKDSSGLMILSNDGDLVQKLSHPSSGKWKRYYIETNPKLNSNQLEQIHEGVELEDGLSKFEIEKSGVGFIVRMQEGRNRQIRRTIDAVGSKITTLNRQAIGDNEIGDLKDGEWREYKGALT